MPLFTLFDVSVEMCYSDTEHQQEFFNQTWNAGQNQILHILIISAGRSLPKICPVEVLCMFYDCADTGQF